MNRWAGGHAAAPSASRLNLSYGGGAHGVGVTTGHEKVYLVFWGSQWGTSSTNSHGDVTLADDPSGAAPYLQELFKGIGTGNERWSGVMTQYCDGVPLNARSCPANSAHVAYPAGGALAGVWVDESGAAPDTASGNQLGSEAVKAAGHFGNTTQASNRDTQYVIISPTGTHPDGFGTTGEFCAWHDDTADPNLPGGPGELQAGRGVHQPAVRDRPRRVLRRELRQQRQPGHPRRLLDRRRARVRRDDHRPAARLRLDEHVLRR